MLRQFIIMVCVFSTVATFTGLGLRVLTCLSLAKVAALLGTQILVM
jgi:hypothetical protein